MSNPFPDSGEIVFPSELLPRVPSTQSLSSQQLPPQHGDNLGPYESHGSHGETSTSPHSVPVVPYEYGTEPNRLVSAGTSIVEPGSVADINGRTYHGYKEGKYFLPNDPV
jgi:hypothetical protein